MLSRQASKPVQLIYYENHGKCHSGNQVTGQSGVQNITLNKLLIYCMVQCYILLSYSWALPSMQLSAEFRNLEVGARSFRNRGLAGSETQNSGRTASPREFSTAPRLTMSESGSDFFIQ